MRLKIYLKFYIKCLFINKLINNFIERKEKIIPEFKGIEFQIT